MLIRQSDSVSDENEWKQFLLTHDFGEIIAPGINRELPLVAPTHFHFDGNSTVSLHFAFDNPIWEALKEKSLAILSVYGVYTYIPTSWNANTNQNLQDGIPTSYYAAVQAVCTTEILDDAADIAHILTLQLDHFQPEGGHAPVKEDMLPYGPFLGAIRGLKLTVTEVRAKFKFGGNKSSDHRLKIAELLIHRQAHNDTEAAEFILKSVDPS